MSCYTRHLGDWLPPEPTWADRRALDAAVRSELGLPDADCPEIWTAVKQRRDDATFGDAVRQAVASHGRPQAGRVGREAPGGAERSEHPRGPAVNSPQWPPRDETGEF